MDLVSVIYNVFSMLDNITTPEGEEDLSYDIESLFMNVTKEDTLILFVRKCMYKKS